MSQNINPKRLFLASRVALVATAMTFAIRANLVGELGKQFEIDAFYMGVVLGTAFWGFTISMIFGGFICDLWGMKRLIQIAFVFHIAGIILTILAQGFWILFFSTLLIGIANGLVEAACNPLVATLFPDHKTTKLNQFHVWFPGGIVIGGLTAFVLTTIGIDHWQVKVGTILIPTLLYGFLFFNEQFPVTERVRSGVSLKEMFKECTKPLFVLMVFCMLISAATELGTNQWITELLSNVGVPSILLLVFINGLMAIGRMFAGEVEHRLSPSGMLLFSAIFSTLGLFLLGNSSGYLAFGSAAIFAVGICYFWPTMLGFVSEYLPKTGALGLSIMGGFGMLSVSLILPLIGKIYEGKTQKYLPTGYTLDSFKDLPADSPDYDILNSAQLSAGSDTLLYVAALPLVLTMIFAWIYFRRKILLQKNL